MASTLEDKIQKLTDTIEDLTGVINSMSGEGGALKSDNAEVRSKAEELAMDRMRYEEKLLARKEKNFDKEEKLLQRKERYENSFVGKSEQALKDAAEVTAPLVNSVKGVFNTAMNMARKAWSIFNEAFGNIDKSAVSAYRTMGMSLSSMESMRKHAVAVADSMKTTRNFVADAADLLKLQSSYSAQLGRNIQLAGAEMENLAAMKLLVGEEQAIKFTANFEKLGIDINSATKEMSELWGDAAKSGLNFTKYSAAVADNLHLAQQYTFANGVDGLKNMVKQSIAVRWNMQQTAAFAEKVSNVEGAITTSAQMSVLGGEFAKFANPMNMLYESLNDMESLNERLMKTFSQFATFNKQTNQIEVSAFDRMRIKAATQAMGLDYGQVMDSVYGMGRAKVAEEQLRGSMLSDEYKTFLKNKAMIDRKDGRAYVNLMQKDGTYKQKYLDEGFSEEDKKSMDLEMRTESQDIKSIAKSALTIEEMLEVLKKEVFAKVAKWIEDKGGRDWVKAKIEQVGSFISKIVGFFEKYIIPYTKQIAYGIIALKVVPALIKTAVMAKSFFSGGGMPMGGYGAPMMMGPGGYGSPAMGGGGGYMPYAFGQMSRGAKWNSMSPAAKARYTSMYGRGATLKNNFKYSPTARMGAGIGLGLASAGLGIGGEIAHANGDHGWGAGLNIASTTAAGASMGLMFGPWGALIGGVGGLIYGGIKELIGHEERKKQEEYQRQQEEKLKQYSRVLYANGITLNGQYTPDELEDMNRGVYTMSSATKQKMIDQGDGDVISMLYRGGGDIYGKSHEQGGVWIHAEGGESVIPKIANEQNRDAVESLINGTFKQKYTPMVAEKPMGDILKVSESNNLSQIGVNRIDFSALNMNMGGTLKLELAGNYKDIDARKLLDDPKFSRTLEGMVRENVAVLGNRNKRHALSRYDNPDPNGRHVRWT